MTPLICSRLRGAALLVLFSTGSASGQALDGSTLTPAGPPPVEGEVFRYALTIAAAAPTSATVEIAMPSAAMFAGIEGLPGAAVDSDGRVVRWQGAITPEDAPRAVISFVAGRDAGGQLATVRATLRPWQGEPTYLAHAADVDTRPAATMLRIGGVGVTAAGVLVLGWLVATGVFWLLLRVVRRRVAAWVPIAIMVPLGFVTIFAWLAREDLRISALPERRCTVVDRELDARSSASSTSTSRSSTVYAPTLVLAYEADGGRRIAQGFGTDSALSRGSAAAAEDVLRRYAIGATVPCAVDDRDPRRAYVVRGFGGAYLFALIPLPILALGVWGLGRGREG